MWVVAVARWIKWFTVTIAVRRIQGHTVCGLLVWLLVWLLFCDASLLLYLRGELHLLRRLSAVLRLCLCREDFRVGRYFGHCSQADRTVFGTRSLLEERSMPNRLLVPSDRLGMVQWLVPNRSQKP